MGWFKKLRNSLEEDVIGSLLGGTIGGVVGGAFKQNREAGEAVARGAAQAQDLGQQALDFNRQIYSDVQQQQQPYQQQAVNALNQLVREINTPYDPSQIINSPEFQAILAQRRRGLENSAAARGRLNSYETLSNIANDTTNFALPMLDYQNNLRNNRLNRLAGIAGLAPNPGAMISAGGGVTNALTTLGNLRQQQGMIQAEQSLAPWQMGFNLLGQGAKLYGAAGG